MGFEGLTNPYDHELFLRMKIIHCSPHITENIVECRVIQGNFGDIRLITSAYPISGFLQPLKNVKKIVSENSLRHSLGWNLMKPSKIKALTQPNIWPRGCFWPSGFTKLDPSWSKSAPARPHHRIAQSHHQIPVC